MITKFLKPILLIFIFSNLEQKFAGRATTVRYIEPPKELPWPNWADEVIHTHICNMTAELLKNVQSKLEQAKTIQQTYKGSITYDLGTVAAGIQDTFEHMLEIYRTYTNETDFINQTHTLDDVLKAYHIIQGDYNQIRLERDLYYETLERHLAERERKRKKIRQSFGGKHPNENKLIDELGGRRTLPELESSVFNDTFADKQDIAPRSRGVHEGLPRLITSTTKKRRLWKYNVKWFGEGGRLND